MASDMSVSSVDEVMVCQAREGQVFVGKKPHYLETVLDSNVVDVQQLNTSDWSSSDAESMQKDSIGDLNSLFIFLKFFQLTQNYLGGLSREIVGTQNILSSKTITPPFFSSTSFICNCHDPGGGSYKAAGENYDPPSFLGEGEGQECEVQGEEDGQWTGSSDEDTMEEELYECKVEVKTRDTTVPTSVRTIESVIDVPGWAPITPYLNVSKSHPASNAEEVSAIFSEGKQGMQYMTAGVVTSPESVMTSTNLITTPDSSISLQSQLSNTEVRKF